MVTPQRSRAILAAILGLYLVLGAVRAVTRPIMTNEAWFASPALTLVSKGYMGTTILEDSGTWFEGIDRYTYWVPPLHLLLQALWYKLFGFGLLTLRSISVLSGAAVLLAWYTIVSAPSGNRAAGLLAAGIGAIDPRLLNLAALGRMDMLCAALGSGALAVYLHFREKSLIRATLLAHVLAAASCLTHFLGGLYVAGLLIFMLYFDRNRIGKKEIALSLLPYAVGLAGWGAYALQAPSLFLAQFFGNVSGMSAEVFGRGRWSGLAAPFTAVIREYLVRYADNFGSHAPTLPQRLPLFALLVYTAAAVWCLAWPPCRRHLGYRALLLYSAFVYLSMALLDGLKNSFYLAHTLPLCASLVAVCAVTYIGGAHAERRVARPTPATISTASRWRCRPTPNTARAIPTTPA